MVNTGISKVGRPFGNYLAELREIDDDIDKALKDNKLLTIDRGWPTYSSVNNVVLEYCD